jgi:hypothetical protein
MILCSKFDVKAEELALTTRIFLFHFSKPNLPQKCLRQKVEKRVHTQKTKCNLNIVLKDKGDGFSCVARQLAAEMADDITAALAGGGGGGTRGNFQIPDFLESTMSLLPHRVASSSLISLTKPITPNTLRVLRDLLKRPDPATPPPTLRSAAVLIPFCNVGGEPGILLEVRSKSLRTHSGEIRCEPLCTLNNKLEFITAT